MVRMSAVRVADVFETTIAMPAYMDLEALSRWLEVRPLADYLNVLVDSAAEPLLFAELKEMPAISAIMLRQAAIDAFYDTLGEHILVFIGIFTGFAAALGFGVAYNSTRIALSAIFSPRAVKRTIRRVRSTRVTPSSVSSGAS